MHLNKETNVNFIHYILGRISFRRLQRNHEIIRKHTKNAPTNVGTKSIDIASICN